MYGTSGPRIELRFFATATPIDAECGTDEWLAEAYEGTAMGGVGTGHRFFHVWVKPDERSNPIQHIQIVRGWLDGTDPQEKVYSVPSENEGLECLTWEAPRTSTEMAFYYVRVLEVPTQRWSANSCEREACPDSIEQLVQERAWSSPIWIRNASTIP